jgi:uncharacterized protein (DUF58 family)
LRIPSPIAGIHRQLRQRVDDWTRRRQGPDRDPIELHRRRIYILPTPLGVAFAAMLFAMLLGGLNYNNNMGLAFAFLLASMALAAMHHCHATLSGLGLQLVATESAFAGQDVGFRLLLQNASVSARPAIELVAGERMQAVADVPAGGSVELRLSLHAERRGQVPLHRFQVATRHPLGLFRAWAVIHPSYAAVAYPRPAARGLAPPSIETDTGGAQDRAVGEEDFTGLRPYQSGDSLRRIAWKAYARGQGLHSKQYAGTDVTSHVFDWDSLAGMDAEARLSQICRWVLDAHDRDEAFGLRLPGLQIDTNLGVAHRDRCLAALAMFEPAQAS